METALLECESNVGSANAYCDYDEYLSVQCASELKPVGFFVVFFCKFSTITITLYIPQTAQLGTIRHKKKSALNSEVCSVVSLHVPV